MAAEGSPARNRGPSTPWPAEPICEALDLDQAALAAETGGSWQRWQRDHRARNPEVRIRAPAGVSSGVLSARLPGKVALLMLMAAGGQPGLIGTPGQ